MKRAFLVAIFAGGLCVAQTPAPVKVEGGSIQGTVEDGLTVYRGIPFAAPPVGDLRWRAPQPAAKWDGVKAAAQFGPKCIQGMGTPGANSGPAASEDCLYLNVWTPAKSANDRVPVLVWIYGGGFNAGATSEPNYSGARLARKGVVLVSIAYRVGSLGFLSHQELSAENKNHASGNYGLLDMIAGLAWVRKNIAAFGGDPRRVTIFGESAGGIAVSMLCASPLAQGLFHGAISQSGGSFGPPRPTLFPGENLKRLEDAERSGEAYAKSAGASSIADLRKIPADKLPAGGRGMGLAWPIIDGWVIPDDQYKLYEAKRYNDTPILVGYNSDEGASFSPPRTPEDYISGVKARYGPFADRLLKAYPTDATTVPKTARDLTRDAAFGWHTWIWARLQAKTGKSKAFYYYFDQHPEYPADSSRAGYGTPHGADVQYVFQHLDTSNPQVTKTDEAISEAMATYWTNFVKRGDPNGEGLPTWPAFSDANPLVMYFSLTPHTGPVPSADSLKVLDAYFAWRRTPEGEAWAQQPGIAPYQDPNLSPEQRAADLVSRMTLEERILQMQNSAPAIPRLGVPVYNWWNEALHGVATGRATVFPESIGLGATWDVDLMHRVADAISTEARAKYHEALRHDPIPEPPPGNSPGRVAGLTYWSPNINIFRDPRWGRGQETYGEDPYLTSRMGVAFVTGMQGDDPHYLKVVATPKHYAVHSGPEPLRHTFDAKVSESDMVNTYLPAFRAAVVEGKADSVMCVYNSVNGAPGCASEDLLRKRLREQWGFQGYVVSDCGAVGDIFRNHKYVFSEGAAAVAAVKAGTDLTCGGEYRSLIDEVKAGHITEAEIDRAAERLFVARFRLGMFDPPERVPYARIPYSENDSAQHRQLALAAEREAIVLLKNQGGILPLKPSVSKIAVFGPSADDPVGLLGNYNGISSKQVTPLEGIAQQFSQAKVQYALGATYTATTSALVSSGFLTPPDGKGAGLLAEYFDNPDFQGPPKLSRTEPRVYYDANMEEPAVVAALHGDKYSIRWTGTLIPPATGDYVLTARTGMWNRDGKIKLFLDDKEVGTRGPAGARPAGLGPGEGQGPRRAGPPPIQLEGGRKYAVKVEYRQTGRGGGAELNWIPPAAAMLAEAEKIAADSDVALLFVGLNGTEEGEGHDRTAIELPEPQESLLKAIVATGKPVVVILTSGSAVAVNTAASSAAAVLSAWYGGEEAGTAIADTLAGVNNPSGRLPVTFYKSTDQLPPFTDYNMKGHTYRYFKGEPLYPFGYGLSYSTFAYSGLTAKRTGTGAEIRATVKNTSSREADEVVQLYITGGSGDDAPIRSLRGFQRTHLKAGESREVKFTVGAEDIPKDKVEISVGGGQPVGSTPHVEGFL